MADSPSPLQIEERRHLRQWRLTLIASIVAGLGTHVLEILDTHSCGGHAIFMLALYALRLALIGVGVTAIFWLIVQVNSSLDKRLPAAVAIAVVAFWLLPVAAIWNEIELRARLPEFERVLGLVEAGVLQPGPGGLVPLPDDSRGLSACGGEVLLNREAATPRVLFFTARGDDHFAGFLHAPDGAPLTGEGLPPGGACGNLGAAGWHFCVWETGTAGGELPFATSQR